VDRHFKFGLQVYHSKSQPADDKLSLKGAWSGSCDPFVNFRAPVLSLERTKLYMSNLVCRLIAVIITTCVLKFHSMGVHLKSHDLLQFGEISVNISEMVQERDILTVKDYNMIRYDTILYYTKCYFIVRSKADISQLNVPHESVPKIIINDTIKLFLTAISI